MSVFLLRMLKKFLPLILFLLLLLGGVIGLNDGQKPLRPAEVEHFPPLQVGDWVLRMGTDADSRIISQAGRSDFSHIGMIVEVEPLMVVHATTSDSGQEEKDQVLFTPLNEFLSPDAALAYAVIRPLFLSDKQKTEIAKRLRQRVGEKFVLAPLNEPHLYCSSLIAEEIRRVKPDFQLRTQIVHVPLFNGEYIFPAAFADYPGTQRILTFTGR